MAAEYQEKRRFPRFVCDTGVRVHPEIGNTGYWGTVGDISLGGCYVFTFSPLPVGQIVTLAIKANDKEINVAGKTVTRSKTGCAPNRNSCTTTRNREAKSTTQDALKWRRSSERIIYEIPKTDVCDGVSHVRHAAGTGG